VGPTSEGLIPGPSIDRLKEIGAWMRSNNQSIYGTTASLFRKLPWGRSTTRIQGKRTTVYLHVFKWPTDGSLLVPGLKSKVDGAYILGGRKRSLLPTSNTEQGLSIRVPQTMPNPLSTTIVLSFKSLPEIEEVLLAQSGDGSVALPASEARLHGSQLRYESGEHRDNIGFWMDQNEWVDWEFKVIKPGDYKVAVEVATTGKTAFEVVSSDQSLEVRAPVTGDYGKFQTVEAGTLTLKAQGAVTLAVRPVKGEWNALNLKEVRLQPAR
jgi:alpha-L-fucosidase